MQQKITRQGNSMGVIVPAAVLKAAGLRAGSYVSVRLLDSGDIRLRPVSNVQPAEAEDAPPAAPIDLSVEAKW